MYIYIYIYTYQIGLEGATKCWDSIVKPEESEVVKCNGIAQNIPRIGINKNVMFPAVQLNLNPAVSGEDAGGESSAIQALVLACR